MTIVSIDANIAFFLENKLRIFVFYLYKKINYENFKTNIFLYKY